MELYKLKEFILQLETKEQGKLSVVIDTINEIDSNLKSDQNSYIHLILREKYFMLIQSIVESNNDLLVKFAFNTLQKFLVSETTCQFCSIKEKSQFLLNILRYIQHTVLSSEISKIEIFKFLLNNHEFIEPLLNSKILNSLIEISINESECENKFLQSSSKALIIKYIAVVCNQISSIKNFQNNENFDDELKILDSFIVTTFTNLLNIFNEQNRSLELRNLLLECIELLLNCLIAEKHVFYDIRKNKDFIEFSWQRFCPSILFQFGDCGLRTISSTTQSLNFKQIYTILIQLTCLLGGDKIMIPVFEAIYQRILFFPPEQDNHILLKLFKSFVNRDFLLSLTLVDTNCQEENDESKNNVNEFTLINVIIGYYRNCFEQSLKQSNDKILQFLSLECIHSYIKLIYDLFEDNNTSIQILNSTSNISFNLSNNSKSTIDFNDSQTSLINSSADFFVEKFNDFIQNILKNETLNLELSIKKFCLNFLEITNDLILKLNSFKILITVYMSFYMVLKNSLNTELNLTSFKFESNPNHKIFFVQRILIYDECDFTEEPKMNESRIYFEKWLEQVYTKLILLTESEKIPVKNHKDQICFLLRQLDVLTKIKTEKGTKVSHCKHLSLVKRLLKCSWTYLLDVLVGFVQNSRLESLELILFKDKFETLEDSILEDLNNEVTFTSFAFKSSLDSLHQLTRVLTNIDGMDKELDQLFYILIESNFYKNNTFLKSHEELSLNKIVSLDFVLYTTSELVFNFEAKNKASSEILWKYLTQATFFSFSLQANLEYQNSDLLKSPNKENNITRFILSKKQKIFRSVISNMNELNEDATINRTKSFDLNEKIQLSDHIVKSLFYFMNKFETKVNPKTSKIDLIDNLSSKCYDFLFNQLFFKLHENKTSFFDHIWNFSSNMCLLSKRFLLDESSFRVENEYFSFNYLIIDKLEDFLGKLMSQLKPQNQTEISIFFTDLWLNVFSIYFQKIFSKCGCTKPAQKDTETRNPLVKLSRKFNKKIDFESYFLIDFSICKKLIYLIQNLFENYNSNSNLNYLEAHKNKKRIKAENLDLIRTPSTGSSTMISSPVGQEHNFSEPGDLIKKLEIYKNNLNVKSDSIFVSKLFYNTATCLLMPGDENELIDFYVIDEVFNLNTLMLLPFKRLMVKKSLETNLKDSILTSLCEIVERTSFRIKNSWNVIFYCLSRVTLDEQVRQKKKKVRNASLNDSFESSTSYHSYQSDSSVYNSDDSDSSSNSSEKSEKKPTLYFSTLPYRFESYRIRLNSLIDVFNIFLSLSEGSSYITANGTFDFLKCVSNYLQYKIALPVDFKIPKKLVAQKTEDSTNENETRNSSDQDDEDLFLSANDYSIQERHYHLTSNYDHLCELSNANNSNTQIKPFILCIEKMFDILTKSRRNDFLSESDEVTGIQTRNFVTSQLEKLADLNIDDLNLYYLSDETRRLIESELSFENQSEIDELNSRYKFYFKNDRKNYSKILIYFFNCLSSRVYLAQDEINSVQIFQLIYDLANRLVELNETETAGYVILEILCQDLNFQIDCTEIKSKQVQLDVHVEAKFNPKLLENTFFLASLLAKSIEKLICLVTVFLKTVPKNQFQKSIHYSVTNRVFYLLSKCLVKKIVKFNSLVDINFVNHLSSLYFTCLNSEDPIMVKKCLSSIKLFHALSLVPFETLIKNYTNISNNSDDDLELDKSEFSNLEVLTQKCKTAWELHNVKRAFNLAKSLLNYEKFYKSNQSLNDLLNASEGIESDFLSHEDDEITSSNDDKNFFRDFTLKFNTDFQTKSSQYFNADYKQVNLTCFINSFKFHSSLINVLKYLTFKLDLSVNTSLLYELLKFLNQTYVTSLKLERNLSLKILLSKIFYLNYETSLASFTDLTKKSFILINFMYFKKDIIRYDLKLKESLSHEIVNYDSLQELTDSPKSNLKKFFSREPKESFFEDFFFLFIKQINDFYLNLNEKSHGFKIDEVYLTQIMIKYDNPDILVESEETLNSEVLELFELYKEKNKNFTMKNIRKDTDGSYADKDAKYLYKIWSYEMIPYLLVNLSEEISEDNKDLKIVKLVNLYSNHSSLSRKEFIKNLAELIVVFNSCSSYCQCTASIENEMSFLKLDFNTIRSISAKLFSILLILLHKLP